MNVQWIVGCALALMISAAARAVDSETVGKKPNFLFILTDDQAPDAVAAANCWGVGASDIRTPNMDRLYQEGTSFSRAYNMGAWQGAVCVASRSMLLSGHSLWRSMRAEKTNFAKEISAGSFWPQRLKTVGYETYMAGKWHIEAPVNQLFDHVQNVRLGMPTTVRSAYDRPRAGKPDTWLPWDESHGGYWAGGKHWSEVLADDAEGFLIQASASTKPFFMYLAFNAPHDPRQSPKAFVDSYPLEHIRMPANFLSVNPHHDAMGLGPTNMTAIRDETLAPFPRTEHAVKTHLREYRALVSHLDTQIGRILAALERSGMAENTYVILTSDHGLALGRHGLMGKQSMYEHSIRVPFVIRGPGIPKGGVRDARIYLQDAMATTIDLAGARRADLDFKSLMPLLKDEHAAHYARIYGAFSVKNQRAVIDGDYKLIVYPQSRTILLFNLTKDPLEMENLAAKPDSAPIVKRLLTRLRVVQRENEDPLILPEGL